MFKKLIITVASGLAVLLVLAFAVTLVLSTRGYFSDVITWLLLGLIGILVLFTIYMVISRAVEVVRHRNLDVEELSEHSIQKMLKTGDIPPVKDAMSSGKGGKPASAANKRKQSAEEAKIQRKQLALEKKREQEEAARAKQAAKRPSAASAPNIASMGQSRSFVTLAEMPPEHTPPPEHKQPAAPATVSPVSPAPGGATGNLEADLQRQREVDNLRQQAEAAAAARRKAAAMAARSQSFPAIKTGQLPAFNTGVLEGAASATDTRAHILNNQGTQRELTHTGSIWERMNVRQSAAPLLNGQLPDAPPPVVPVQTRPAATTRRFEEPPAAPAETAPLSPASQAVPPWQQTAQEPGQPDEAAGWNYTPAKPPKAWNTAGGRIPGDMASFAVPNTVQPPPIDTATRTEQARAKASAAAATAENAKAKTAATKAKTAAAKPASATADDDAEKRPRGRPPKPKTEEELNQPKRPRGRPPKPKTEEELNQPKRPRGRPRKNPLPEDGTEE